MLSTEQPDTDAGTTNRKTTWQLTKGQQTNFIFFKVYEIYVKKKKNLTQLRSTENSRWVYPKIPERPHSQQRDDTRNYTADGEKGTRRQYNGLGTEMYPPTKKRTRENGAKMRPVRTGTLQGVPLQTNYHSMKTGRTMLWEKRFRGSTMFGGAAPNKNKCATRITTEWFHCSPLLL